MHRNRHGNARAGGQRPGTPVLASAGLWNCTVTQEGLRPSCGTRWKRTPASRLYASSGSDNDPDNPCCYFASLPLPSVQFPSDGFAARSPRKRGGESIGKEWVIDWSLLDFVFSYLYLYFIALDFPTSVFPTTDNPTTEMPTTAKGQGTVYLCLALYRPYRAEAGIIVQTSKVVNR